ncbi:ATP-binding protein [Gloeothece verrucosa]|uniref:histidine kinase n=1 Tax=Gloeothece verrucosa (strain PCC 7822) TaxID=497965 RepID=E0UGQ6_GLOV7|nr:ATP-binding protein [Gloeothece verrucosa]ADN13265.1 histidine kinase [Gloeothece verrucosa PCC 7822]
MNKLILTLKINSEQDVVIARQRTRQLAGLLGFDAQDQTRIATAVSEICRNAFQYAGSGKVEFSLDGKQPQCFLIQICDSGKGISNLDRILDGDYNSTSGMGLMSSRRLMDRFDIKSIPQQGTKVLLGKNLPKRVPPITKELLIQIVDKLAQTAPQNPLLEIQQQNQELLQTLAQLRQREEDLLQLNQELEETNRGVVALYAELDQKAESLKRVSELKSRFLSNMSHEFRTPLNSILSLSNFLLKRMDGELNSEQEKQVTFIRNAAQQLSEMVNDLLDLAKVEAGKTDIYADKFEIGDLFGTLRGMFRPLLINNSSVSLIFEDPDHIPSVYSDEGKIAQILKNFISNALKYTEKGTITVAAVPIGNHVTFSVADTGIGIAPENLESIFDEFVQLKSPLQKRVKGTGLGLPISRKLAQLLGGDVSVISELGKGSTFFLNLPIDYRTDEPKLKELPQLDAKYLPILVVDDNPETRFTYESYFKGSCYQMMSSTNLEQAEKVVRSFKPKALILDNFFKKENYSSFLARIKSDQEIREIPCLVIDSVNDEEKLKALGIDAFLNQPLNRESLLKTLNGLLKKNIKQTILLIDDEKASQNLFKDYLNDTDLNFIEASNGIEGIRLAKEKKPQVIVLDLVMPEMSGQETLLKLKNDLTTCQIPVIINSLKPLEESERQELTRYAVAILSKNHTSQEKKRGEIREALLRAGLYLKI